MPDVTLTPVAGDPFNGGAQELDPATAPPLTINLAQQNAALPGAVDDFGRPVADAMTPDAGTQAVANVGSSLVSGRAGDDFSDWIRSNYPNGPGALRAAAFTAPMIAARTADAFSDGPHLAGDVMAGRVDPMSQDGIERAARFTMSLAPPGLGTAEEGAVGMMGGKLATKGAKAIATPADDPLAALLAKLDAQAPEAAAPKTMAETGVVDPHAASWPLYHGTGDAWDVFDPSKAGARTSGAQQGAMFMSPREGEAASYAHGDGARVLPLTVTPGNTGVYDVGQLLATRDPRFMAASRAEHTGSQAAYDAALQRYDADVAYHQDLRSRMPADLAAEMPDYPAASNLLSPQSAAISMARADGRDTAILRGLGESSGGDQVVALRPGFVHDAVTGRQVYSGGLPIPGAASTVPAALQPNTPTPEMFGRMLREGKAT